MLPKTNYSLTPAAEKDNQFYLVQNKTSCIYNIFSSNRYLINLILDKLFQKKFVGTIVRPAVLNDQPASGKCRASNSGSVRKISRADLADFLVKQISDKSYIRQAISVTS